MLQHPAPFGSREIGVQDKPGFGTHGFFIAGLPQSLAGLGCPLALPDDSGMNREAGMAVPQNSCLPLVRYGESGKARRPDSRLAEHILESGFDLPVDFQGVMLHPARLRIILNMLRRASGDDTAIAVHHQRLGSGGALINYGNHVLGCTHSDPALPFSSSRATCSRCSA
ncbi:hypothetical protein D3C75_656950 [compost metagenome]